MKKIVIAIALLLPNLSYADPVLIIDVPGPWDNGAFYSTAMDNAFGANKWTQHDYVTAETNYAAIFAPTTNFIYLQGSDSSDINLNNFVQGHEASMLNWVNAGGNLIVESAGNSNQDIIFNIAKVTLKNPVYSESAFLTPEAIQLSGKNPIVNTIRIGNSIAHDIIIPGTGVQLTVLAIGKDGNNVENGPIVASLKYGKGSILFSGLTTYNFHSAEDGSPLDADAMSWLTNFIAAWSNISFGPSTVDTQSSLQNTAQKLRGVFNLSTISSNFANMNTYDCNLFDTRGLCISAGGRFTTVDSPNASSSSAVVVLGYKATDHIRVGGFLDQSVNNSTPSGIHISNKNPMMGAFAVWNQNTDSLGYQVKVANAYQEKNISITREVIGTSEAGAGSTDLNIQSYVGELSYAFRVKEKTLLRPYLALRHTKVKQDSYTEKNVANPLSYASLEDRSTTALIGLKVNHAVTAKATLTASIGVEQDLERKVDQFTATSENISGLTSENFSGNIRRTRPVASAGAYYAVAKSQRISGDLYYQQLPFQSTGATTAYFNYTIGF